MARVRRFAGASMPGAAPAGRHSAQPEGRQRRRATRVAAGAGPQAGAERGGCGSGTLDAGSSGSREPRMHLPPGSPRHLLVWVTARSGATAGTGRVVKLGWRTALGRRAEPPSEQAARGHAAARIGKSSGVKGSAVSGRQTLRVVQSSASHPGQPAPTRTGELHRLCPTAASPPRRAPRTRRGINGDRDAGTTTLAEPARSAARPAIFDRLLAHFTTPSPCPHCRCRLPPPLHAKCPGRAGQPREFDYADERVEYGQDPERG
jgi:hypothetical protein